MNIRDLFEQARRTVAGLYQIEPGEPVALTADAAILIQYSPADAAWLASLIKAPVPVRIGLIVADGATPAKALNALDDKLEQQDDFGGQAR